MADWVYSLLKRFYQRFFPTNILQWMRKQQIENGPDECYDTTELHSSYLRDAEEHETWFPEVTNINQLPYSVLVKIFSYLSVEDRLLDLCFVCKHWHQVCHDQTFWKEIDFSDRSLVTDEVLLRAVTFSKNVQSVNLRGASNKRLTREGLIALSKACPMLETLKLTCSASCLNEETVISMIQNCPRLKHLQIAMMGLTDETMLTIANCLKDLEFLSVNKNHVITDDGAIAVIRSCKKLTTLRMEDLKITDKTIAELVARESTNPTMVDLNVEMAKFSPKSAESLAKLKNLEVFYLTRCKGFTYENLKPIVLSMTKLTRLSLCMNDELDNRVAKLLAMNLKQLKDVFLTSIPIDDSGMACFARHGKNLEMLDVGYSKVTEKGVENVCQSLPKLKWLGLTRCEGANKKEVEILAHRFSHVQFVTFLQDAKRMLVKRGCWDHSFNGVLTEKKILEQMSKEMPPPYHRRKIASGGVIEYFDTRT
nr:F-box/LRR-repeat protein 17 [Ciona intestinalis]|eukprot:XP_002119406.1 F-box/LRR-repeat protein 17 [Ciona intestinalis]